MAKRVKRLTMFKADRPPFSDKRDLVDRLVQKDLLNIGEDQVISIFPSAAAEELDREEREIVYKLLGYDTPDPDKPLIAKRAGVVGGRAAVAGTRVPVWQIVNSERQGVSRCELRMQSGLSDEQIGQALAYAEAHQEEIDRDIFENDLAASLAGAGPR